MNKERSLTLLPSGIMLVALVFAGPLAVSSDPSALTFLFLAVVAIPWFGVLYSLEQLRSSASGMTKLNNNLIRAINGEPVEGQDRDFQRFFTPQGRLNQRGQELSTESAMESSLRAWQLVLVEHSPAVFTSVGILFTFAGLIIGLGGLDLSAGSEGTTQSMQHMIAGVALAFRSSLSGLILSVGSLFATRVQRRELDTAISKIRWSFELYEKNTPENDLNKLVGYGKRIDDRQARLLDVAHDQHAALGQLSSDLSSVLTEALAAPLKSLSDGIQSMARGGADVHREALEQVMGDFLTEFRQHMSGQFTQLREVLELTLEWHQSTQTTLTRVHDRLDSAAEQQVSVLSRQLELLQSTEAVTARREALLEQEQNLITAHFESMQLASAQVSQVGDVLKQADNRWAEIQSALSAHTESVREAVHESTQSHLASRDVSETLARTLERWQSQLDLTADRYENLAANLRDSLHAGLYETFEQFDAETAKIVDHLNGSALKVEESHKHIENSLKHLQILLSSEQGPGLTKQFSATRPE